MDMNTCAQLYYPATGVGAYIGLHQDTEFSIPSGHVDRLGISRRQLDVFRLFFIQCQDKNAYMFHGERSISSVLFSLEC